MKAVDEDLNSEFEYQSETENRKRRKTKTTPNDLSQNDFHQNKWPKTAPSKDLFVEEQRKEENKKQRLLCLDAYSRHKQLINEYFLYYPGATKRLGRDTCKDKTDIDIIRQHHKFLWEPSEEPDTWEKKLAKRYYDKLFKEYCIVDLSRYKENKVAMRWRTEVEVVNGTGQFSCASKKCPVKENLSSWEVNFSYLENCQKKNALVKLRLCPDCSYKLNFRHKRKLVTRPTKKQRAIQREKRRQQAEASFADFAQAEQGQHSKTKSEEAAEVTSTSRTADQDVWKKPVEIEQDRPREEDFEDFLDDLLL